MGRNAGMLRASAFLLAEHGAPASLAALAAAGEGRFDAAELAEAFGSPAGLIRAVFEEYLAPRTGPLLDRLARAPSVEAALAGFAEEGDAGGRLLAPFLQASIEARGLFGERRLLGPTLAAMRRDAGLPPTPRAAPGEAEIAVALLADFALLAGPAQVHLPGGRDGTASGTALRLVVGGAAKALRELAAGRSVSSSRAKAQDPSLT
jgi:hypothetical protein